ncbi:putative 43kDa postsynaptic protein [Helianthus annuus]|uniref:43kDa postsynaptic protein n=1 Tax=Helianthus annuus TaxID=4232 RepID=A0A251SJG7_HELAN|nr:protein KINESIN LIGHT CHAIN-RELATED 2 [Helianthus annuus]KAF5769952.1 putative 43kDa postsynaptic protein [Helianthus annuus]KAJ0464906.1 putative tetratricopeptide-like helical domain superfamily [Helianthus annuus]KAJ0486498.1 putative tetratricopeptide-like helical domain superfamily [Helianthus annuus]KAJ0657064.1 putative tetratricopeptide-like helical domain superfamily [Helianthus annuus]KAJ0660646.1 putative tetratricopeptide-like helical domain superfamily [Helianthus annuus]
MSKSGVQSSSHGNLSLPRKNLSIVPPPRSSLSTQELDNDIIDLDQASPLAADTYEQLFRDAFDEQSVDGSPVSSVHDINIELELRSLAAGGHAKGDKTMKRSVIKIDTMEPSCSTPKSSTPKSGTPKSGTPKAGTPKKLNLSPSVRSVSSPRSPLVPKPKTRSKSFQDNNLPLGSPRIGSPRVASPRVSTLQGSNKEDPAYLGPYLLKQTQELISSGENPKKCLELGIRAMKAFETGRFQKPNLEYVMCLHIVAALYCSLGQYGEAIPVLERSIEIPSMGEGHKNSLAKFAGCMQLGDTHAMLGYIENSILCYTAGLGIQRQVLGVTDPRFGETCRYVAEAHIQALEFDEAKKLCQMALDIHKANGSTASVEEAADRRLMGLVCDAKGEYEAALEHYVLASITMSAAGQDSDVAAIDVCIGDAYLSLARYDEAVFAYQKALNVFKATKGDNHPSVASVFVRLAELYNKMGKFRESKSYCGNALRIYEKPMPGSPNDEIGNGFIEVAAIYESMNEIGPAINLLKKALKVFGKVQGQLSTIAGVEAQMGVLYYMMRSYSDSYDYFKVAVSKLRVVAEKKSALFGNVLNQMGLACVQIDLLDEAADLFEEAKGVLEVEYGPHHPDTLGVYSNLAGTYDAMGRWDDAIEILEYVVGMREEKLGTASSDVDDEKRRLAQILKDAGRDRSKKDLSLEFLLDG